MFETDVRFTHPGKRGIFWFCAAVCSSGAIFPEHGAVPKNCTTCIKTAHDVADIRVSPLAARYVFFVEI